MKNIYLWVIYVLILMLLSLNLSQRNREIKILEELKEINSTLEYIDTRMDTLEFYRMPEYKK